MIYNMPAFWAKYRGVVDPQMPFGTVYTYTAFFYHANQPVGGSTFAYNLAYSVLGPPQLTKANYIELRWTVPPGVIGIMIEFPPANPAFYYMSNAAESGTRDEGRFNILGSGVLNQ